MRDQSNRSARLDSLEPRRLFAIAPVFPPLVPSDPLPMPTVPLVRIMGTSGNDVIGMSRVGNQYLIQINDPDYKIFFNVADLKGIIFELLGGRDTLVIETDLVVSVTVMAGDGDDFVYTGAGNDRIEGGLGNDTLYGNGGNDRIYGDGGADRLVGGQGRDYLFGGTGRDRSDRDVRDRTRSSIELLL